MGDKEILAEYKIAYEQLQDIVDNAMEGQITAEEVDKIKQVMDNLEFLYSKLYNRIKEREDISLYYEKNVLIADEISLDYIDNKGNMLAAGDLNWQKWWEDYDFLVKI